MASTLSSPSSVARRSPRRDRSTPAHSDRSHARSARSARRKRGVLARYIDCTGCPREIVIQPGFAGSVLVVDHELASAADRRLIAHLDADEPPENAAIVSEHYLERARAGRCRCRLLTAEDCQTAPFAEPGHAEPPAAIGDEEPLDDRGRRYRLEPLQTGMSIPELRWREHPPTDTYAEPRPVSVREAIAHLQDYEPVRALTAGALVLGDGDARLSTTVLRAELERVLESPILLNRRLREAVLATIEREQLSMSEIAIRCGRVKRDCAGNESGETSWLARRLGILPEGGRHAPTPWVHSDVLALIARRGLGISPREVEL